MNKAKDFNEECPDHPNYNGIKYPTINCFDCLHVWQWKNSDNYRKNMIEVAEIGAEYIREDIDNQILEELLKKYG